MNKNTPFFHSILKHSVY